MLSSDFWLLVFREYDQGEIEDRPTNNTSQSASCKVVAGEEFNLGLGS